MIRKASFFHRIDFKFRSFILQRFKDTLFSRFPYFYRPSYLETNFGSKVVKWDIFFPYYFLSIKINDRLHPRASSIEWFTKITKKVQQYFSEDFRKINVYYFATTFKLELITPFWQIETCQPNYIWIWLRENITR